MQVFARATKARKALEIGVFTGYSAISVALGMQALHGDAAKLVALELSAEAVAKAGHYWTEAGLTDVIEPRIGPAVDHLADLIGAGEAASFDLAFIDADKPNYDTCYEMCLELVRPGGVLLIDNMFWGGAVANFDRHGPCTDAVRDLAIKMHGDSRVEISLATIGDGLALVIKR